jgi:hypothetical protein
LLTDTSQEESAPASILSMFGGGAKKPREQTDAEKAEEEEARKEREAKKAEKAGDDDEEVCSNGFRVLAYRFLHIATEGCRGGGRCQLSTTRQGREGRDQVQRGIRGHRIQDAC